MNKYLLLLLALLLASCASNDFPFSVKDNEIITLHYVSLGMQTKLTSIYADQDTTEFRSSIDRSSYLKFTELNNSWLQATVYANKNFHKCLEQIDNLPSRLNSLFYNDLFASLDVHFNIYIIPSDIKFRITSVKNNNELAIFFSQSDCNLSAVKSMFLTIANQIVHESTHLYIYEEHIQGLDDLEEEEIAHGLELCNIFYSKLLKSIKVNNEFKALTKNAIYKKSANNESLYISDLGKEKAQIRAKRLMEKLSSNIDKRSVLESQFKEEYCEPYIEAVNPNF